jgi:hypothetical protein
MKTSDASMIDIPCAACGWLWKSFPGELDGKHIANCSRCDGDQRHGKVEIVDGEPQPRSAAEAKVPSAQQSLFEKAR